MNHLRQIYQRAGYNFDDSVMQCLSDEKIQPGFAFSQPYDQTSAYSTMVFFSRIVDMAKKVPPDKFLSGKMFLAVSDYIAKAKEIEKKELEEEQAKLERQKAQIKEAQDKKIGLLKLVPGNYRPNSGSGELKVSLFDGNKIKFSLYRFFDNYPNEKCNISDIEVPLIYDENMGFYAIYETGEHKTRCFFILYFKKDGSSVEVTDERGSCSSYCNRGGTFMGLFKRVTIQE